MKKITILFLSVLTLGLSVSGCSKDDDENTSIVGKWELIKEGTIISGQEVLGTVENECAPSYYEFASNGTVKDIYSEEGETAQCESFTDNGTYTLVDKTLIMTYPGDSGDSYQVLTINSSTLKLKETIGDFVYISEYKRK